MDIGSNASNEEIYRVTGTLPPERIESLLDLELQVNSGGVKVDVGDAFCGYPTEDCLHEIIVAIQNRTKTKELLELVERVQSELYNDGEYASSDLARVSK